MATNNTNGTMPGRTLLVVHTGSIKKRFIFQKLKRLGLTVVVLNREKNWARAYVDHWILADTSNYQESIAAVKQFLKDNPQIKLEGVITFWEESVLLTSKIADAFNLIGIPYRVAKRARDKYLFREFCAKNNLPAPRHVLIQNERDFSRINRELTYPLVLKPIYGSSSAFVIKVNGEEELKETYDYIKRNITTHPDSAEWENLDILGEEYIDGDEVDIDMILQNGKVKFYSITDNHRTNEPFFIETGFSIPSNLPLKNQQELIDVAEEVLEKLGIQNGCIHFEAKSTNKGAVPVEINLRIGEDETYTLIKEAWGVDLIEHAVRVALGVYSKKITKSDIPRKYVTGYNFLSEHSGLIVKLDVSEELKKQRYVEALQLFKEVGDAILVPPEGYEYLGWIAVSGESPLDAQSNLKSVVPYIGYEIAKFHAASSLGKTLRKDRFSYAALNKDMVTRGAKIERIRRISIENQRSLHIGIACNIYDDNQGGVEGDLMSVGRNIEQALKERGYRVTFFDFNNVAQAFQQLKESAVDLVFNVCERINNSSLLEPHAAGLLDILEIPYTGSNPFTLALCLDKIRVKKLLTYHNIPTPKWDYAYSLDDSISDDLQYPLMVKPANTDDSIGITNESVVTTKEGLKAQLRQVIGELGRPALVEEYIEGDEYDVSILGSDEEDLRVLPLRRAIFKDLPAGYWHIYSFAAKFEDDPVYEKIIVQHPPRNISKKLESLITEIALDTYNILDCHDYGRVEIRVDKDENPYILELNPNPSIDRHNCASQSARLVGMDYADFLEEIIRMAINRYKNRPSYYHLQTNLL